MSNETENYLKAWQREKKARLFAEQLLEDRARELYLANLQLKEINETIKANQQQLIQHEKMASLGILAAGVAHEINNPIGYSLSNLSVLKEYVTNLETFFRMLQQSGGLPAEIREYMSSNEFKRIMDDSGALTAETMEGLESVKKIVADLQGFSRYDRGKIESADLNEGIKSTINVLGNKLKYSADVTLELQPLPRIPCDIAKLNQVFLNIILNAAQSTRERVSIIVRSRAEVDKLVIEVQDNGDGMLEEHIGSLFDPFFTTKPVGEGTGLGLAISYRIVVEEHGGMIDVKSALGEGTTFIISIPRTQPGGEV